jgi:hypothetical protein
MANRLFLTLLALLTGLAAQLAPAQARVCAQQAAPIAITMPAPARVSAAPAELARLPEPGWRHARLVARDRGDVLAPLCRVASVRIGIDRARQ